MEENRKLNLNLELSGSFDEINKTIEGIGEYRNVRIRLIPFPGGWPIPILEYIDRGWLEKLYDVAKMERRVYPQYITDPRGGRRFLHVHFDDNIIALNVEEFKDFTSQVATRLVGELSEKLEYNSIVDKVSTLMIDTVPWPE